MTTPPSSSKVEALVRRLHDEFNGPCPPDRYPNPYFDECPEMKRFRRAVLAALELAAETAEEVDDVEAKGAMGSYYAQLGDARETRKAIVAAIRSLATPVESVEEEP